MIYTENFATASSFQSTPVPDTSLRTAIPFSICSGSRSTGFHQSAYSSQCAVGVAHNNCALISGLIEKRHPGQEKSGRQVTVSSDLIYDVLREHEPDHILLQATRADAATGLLDVKRLGEMLSRIKGRIVHKALDQISPLAVPIMLEIGRVPIFGESGDAILAEAADDLIEEAMGARPGN